MSTKYVFQSEPQAVQHARGNRTKYREAEHNDSLALTNMMYDRRVLRGNTHAVLIPTSNQLRELERLEVQEAFRAKTLKVHAELADEKARREALLALEAPVAGRVHRSAQCDEYLLDQTDPDHVGSGELKRFSLDIGTQFTSTDGANQIPLIIWNKNPLEQIHKSTQIEDGDLFDFDTSAAMLVEVVVGKALDIGINEVRQEEEVKALQTQKEWFVQKRESQLLERRRLENEAKLRKQANDALLAEARMEAIERSHVARKVASCSIADLFLANLQSDVFSDMEKRGLLMDPLRQEIEDVFMPWLTQMANFGVRSNEESKILIDEILLTQIASVHFEVINGRRKAEADVKEKQCQAEAKIAAAETARLNAIREAEEAARLQVEADQERELTDASKVIEKGENAEEEVDEDDV